MLCIPLTGDRLSLNTMESSQNPYSSVAGVSPSAAGGGSNDGTSPTKMSRRSVTASMPGVAFGDHQTCRDTGTV